jgi:hypothetical protein
MPGCWNWGASGVIAAVLGSTSSSVPARGVLTFIFPIFLVRIPAWIFHGVWFLCQLIEANFGLFNAHPNGGGVAFFAHVGGFISAAGDTAPRPGRDRPRPGSNGAPLPSAGDGGADPSRLRYSQY